jgi:diadenylate cyclase
MNLINYITSNLMSLQFTENIFLVDVLDVVIIAFFIYLGLFFLKQARSLLTFAGVISLVLIYFVARIFNLHLTVLVLQSFFGIFLIVLVIVFQDELRKFFEFLSIVNTRNNKNINKKISQSSAFVSTVVQAVFNLAREKKGALIVFPGQDLLERHLDGGEMLDGIVSRPLIESIFDPDSAGHDGALIINKNRIFKFGVHLPLSKNFKQIKGRGTRHSAAIGISEKTDCFVVVVSEERGEISIAQNGKLKTLKDFEELESYLNRFLKEKFPQKPSSFFENIIKKNTIEKFSALFLSFFLWFFLVFQVEIIQRDFIVPISYRGVPDQIIIKDTTPSEVVVTLSGRGQTSFANFDHESLSVTIDGKIIEEGVNKFEIEKNNLRYPLNLSVVNVTPAIVKITAQEFELHNIPIKANIKNKPEYLVAFSVPETIGVLVPKKEKIPDFLNTELIDNGNIEKGTIVTTKIIIPSTLQLPGQASRDIFIHFKDKD